MPKVLCIEGLAGGEPAAVDGVAYMELVRVARNAGLPESSEATREAVIKQLTDAGVAKKIDIPDSRSTE